MENLTFSVKISNFFFLNKLFFKDCFAAKTGGILQISEFVNVKIKHCEFRNGLSDFGAVFYIRDYAKVFIEDSKIYQNFGWTNLIDISDSIFFIKDTIFYENFNNIILLSGSNFSCINTSFLNHSCMLNSQGCILSAFKESYIGISSNLFENILSLSENNIYLLSSHAILQNISFISVRTKKNKGNIIGSAQSYLSIINGFMSKYEGNALNLEESNIEISDTKLLNNLFNKRGLSPVIIINCFYFRLIKVQFENNSYSDQGGAISMMNTLKMFFTQSEYIIMQSNFSLNTATKGGAIYLKNQNLSIINSTFKSNEADYGGAIFCELDGIFCFINIFKVFFFNFFVDTLHVQTIISKNYFINNKATIDGGGIKWAGFTPFFSENYYDLNKAQYGNNIASYPIKMRLEIFENIQNSSKLIYSSNENIILNLYEINPGNKIQFHLVFSLLDIYEETVVTQKG